MKSWIETLSDGVCNRLMNCRTIKSDLPELVNAKWLWFKEIAKDKKCFTKEDALISVLELLDCNSCYIDLTTDEYNELCK